jgi:hypothetical protein
MSGSRKCKEKIWSRIRIIGISELAQFDKYNMIPRVTIWEHFPEMKLALNLMTVCVNG